MLTMVHAQYIGKLNYKIAIKGDSSIFVLTDRQPGAIMWHFTENEMLDGPDFTSLDVHKMIRDYHYID